MGLAVYVPSRVGEGYFTDWTAPASGSTDTGKVWVWNHATGRFEPALFELAGVAATALAGHVAAADPHSQYLLASGVSGFGATLIDDADAATARGTLGLGTMATATEANYLLVSGTRAGATGQAQTFTNGIISNGAVDFADASALVGANFSKISVSSTTVRGLRSTTSHSGNGNLIGVEIICNTSGSNNIAVCLPLQLTTTHVSTGTIGDWYAGFYARTNSGGNITNAYSNYLTDVSGSGTVTNNYGLYIESQTKGSINYAIYTNAGMVRLGDIVQLADGRIRPIADSITAIRLQTAGGTDVAVVDTVGAVLDVIGTLRADAFRLDVTPAAETPTATHTITISANGTNYKLLCVAA